MLESMSEYSLEGKKVGFIPSHVFDKEKFDQTSAENISRYVNAFQNGGAAKIVFFTTGMLNLPTRVVGDEYDKRKEAFGFTLDYLRSIVDIVVDLKIPFEIIPLECIFYPSIACENGFSSIEHLFVKGNKALTLDNLNAWGVRVIDRLERAESLPESEMFKRAYKAVEERCKSDPEYSRDCTHLVKKVTSSNRLKKEANTKFVYGDGSFNICISRLNEAELKKTGEKRVDALVYTGETFTTFLRETERLLVLPQNRAQLIQLVSKDNKTCFVEVPVDKKSSPSQSKKSDTESSASNSATNSRTSGSASGPSSGSNSNNPTPRTVSPSSGSPRSGTPTSGSSPDSKPSSPLKKRMAGEYKEKEEMRVTKDSVTVPPTEYEEKDKPHIKEIRSSAEGSQNASETEDSEGEQHERKKPVVLQRRKNSGGNSVPKDDDRSDQSDDKVSAWNKSKAREQQTKKAAESRSASFFKPDEVEKLLDIAVKHGVKTMKFKGGEMEINMEFDDSTLKLK